ncbi:hypothetical protein TNCV_3565371 [Trichonephila clavipes]|nr:hypothetical protein TNCV_3565371 [Trichonephila clavipes]
MTLADCRRPLFACRIIYRSSPAVVVLGRPPPTFLTDVPVVWNSFEARETTLLLIPNSADTLVTGNFKVLVFLDSVAIQMDLVTRLNAACPSVHTALMRRSLYFSRELWIVWIYGLCASNKKSGCEEFGTLST